MITQRELAWTYAITFLFAIIYDKLFGERFFPNIESFIFSLLVFLAGFFYLTSTNKKGQNKNE